MIHVVVFHGVLSLSIHIIVFIYLYYIMVNIKREYKKYVKKGLTLGTYHAILKP
nr:MAG TPA: hypothetical protein [Caudoviricetes sp.]